MVHAPGGGSRDRRYAARIEPVLSQARPREEEAIASRCGDARRKEALRKTTGKVSSAHFPLFSESVPAPLSSKRVSRLLASEYLSHMCPQPLTYAIPLLPWR